MQIMSLHDQIAGMNSMVELYQARQRYVRVLDALGKSSPIDQDLRVELTAAINAIDRKIECGKAAHTTATHHNGRTDRV